jgi:phosphatidylglycerol:prolipoprotein diacylglycerol transferase
MAALGLSQRTARYAGLKAEAVWDAGVAAVVAAFVISRLLLVVFNLRSFVADPWLVLALPSLTGSGVLLTAIFMLGYVRWRRLPLLRLLDAAAPCGALLWAFLSLGRVVDGTREGMRAGGSGFVHPVELYACFAAALVCVVLLRVLLLARGRSGEGLTAGLGLGLAGVAIFFIDFFRLPSDLLSEAWPNAPLDPSQIMGVAMLLTGIALARRAAAPAPMRENEATDAV